MTIAFVPLRCGSKGIPFKNIQPFCGKPLCYWTLQAIESSCIDYAVVATDCIDIKEIVENFNFQKISIYIREDINAQDTSSTESVMLEYIDKNPNLREEDLFILVQATSPLTESKDIDNAIQILINGEAQSLLSCTKTKRFFWDPVNKLPINYSYDLRPRRQDFEGFFVENGAFYINTIRNIKKYKNRLCSPIEIYQMEDYKEIEIDEILDWKIAETLMKEYQGYRLEQDKILNSKIKLFITDVDGTLTDGGMYYYDNGIEGKKFNTLDGQGFEILRTFKVKTAILTGENNQIIEARGKKLKIDYIYMGLNRQKKYEKILEICQKEKISLSQVAYIGDDLNCYDALMHAGIKACPNNAHKDIKKIPNIILLKKKGGEGAVREFIEIILERNLL